MPAPQLNACDSPVEISDIASRNTNILVGSIAKALAFNSPWINVLSGGTFPSGVSDEIRNVIQMPAAPGDSLAIPTFLCDTEMCGRLGTQALTDVIDMTTRLESFRENGPNVCVSKGYSAFRGSYLMAEDALKKLITQYINADIRAQLYLRSASKFVAASGYSFDCLFTGGEPCHIGVKFAQILPTGPMTFKALSYLSRHLKEVLLGEWFSERSFRVIASADQIEYFRNEIGVQNVMIALTTGGYKLGENSLTAYSFETSPAYRGISFAVDQRPLRATGFNADGTLALVDPVTIVSNVCKGTAYSKVNPAWLAAPYEVGFMLGEGSFERLVPERYVGEGSFKFAPQLHMGELHWHYVRDNGCNSWGDFGHHQFQITRAYKALRPEHVIVFLYKRCQADLGLVECVDDATNSCSGSDSFVTLNECDTVVCDPSGC